MFKFKFNSREAVIASLISLVRGLAGVPQGRLSTGCFMCLMGYSNGGCCGGLDEKQSQCYLRGILLHPGK